MNAGQVVGLGVIGLAAYGMYRQHQVNNQIREFVDNGCKPEDVGALNNSAITQLHEQLSRSDCPWAECAKKLNDEMYRRNLFPSTFRIKFDFGF